MTTIRKRHSLIVLMLLTFTTPAWGALVQETVHLRASGFHDYYRDSVYPFSPIDTTFSFIYDDTAPATPATPLGYDLGFPAPFGQNLNYAVDKGSFIPGSVQNVLTVGQYVIPGGINYLPGTIGLEAIIGLPRSKFYDWLYVTFDDHQFYPDQLTFQFTASSPVPEATSWAIFIAGFGLIGVTMRRRRSNVSVGRTIPNVPMKSAAAIITVMVWTALTSGLGVP
jgi:hypothetical protein